MGNYKYEKPMLYGLYTFNLVFRIFQNQRIVGLSNFKSLKNLQFVTNN
jgi:hypothetical protein